MRKNRRKGVRGLPARLLSEFRLRIRKIRRDVELKESDGAEVGAELARGRGPPAISFSLILGEPLRADAKPANGVCVKQYFQKIIRRNGGSARSIHRNLLQSVFRS